jgi:hypothetical protein
MQGMTVVGAVSEFTIITFLHLLTQQCSFYTDTAKGTQTERRLFSYLPCYDQGREGKTYYEHGG